MAVIPMYYHYDECGTPCGAVDLNVCGETQHVDYFHHNRDGVDLVFVSHPAFYENASAIYGGGTMGVTWRGALLSQAAIEAVWHVPCGGFPFGTDNLVRGRRRPSIQSSIFFFLPAVPTRIDPPSPRARPRRPSSYPPSLSPKPPDPKP